MKCLSEVGAQRGESPAAAAARQQVPRPATTLLEARGDDERRRRRYWVSSALILLLALLGGTAYALAPRTASEAVVPHLVGASSIEEARELAGDRFEVVEGSRVEGTEAVGTIVAQDPYAGETAEEGAEISVDVVGTRIAEVPDVKGKTREEAERILKGAGFEIEVKTASSSAEDENLVIGQNPRGDTGEAVKVGSAVAITVGEGPANVEVPSIDGQTLSGTKQILEEAGLKLGSQMEVPNDQVPAGHIVEQHPAAGAEVEPGSSVDVVVSSGPQQPPTPNAEDATQSIGSTAPASTAPASAAPAMTADDEVEFEDEFGEDGLDDGGNSGPDDGGNGGPGRH